MQYSGYQPVVLSRNIVRGYAWFRAGDQRSTARAVETDLWELSGEQLIFP